MCDPSRVAYAARERVAMNLGVTMSILWALSCSSLAQVRRDEPLGSCRSGTRPKAWDLLGCREVQVSRRAKCIKFRN